MPTNADGQTFSTSGTSIVSAASSGCMATAFTGFGVGGVRYFLTETTPARVVELTAGGAIVPGGIPMPGGARGMAAYPLPPGFTNRTDPGGVNPAYWGHLMVGTPTGDIYDVDPGGPSIFRNPGTSPPSSANLIFSTFVPTDGICLAPNGAVLYAAIRGGADCASSRLVGYSMGTPYSPAGTVLYDSGPVFSGIDGIAIGLGSLGGYAYANCNDGKVWEIPLPALNGNLGPSPADPTGMPRIVVSGGSRGDFISVDANVRSGGFPSLVFSQSADFWRLDPPGGGWWGPNAPSTSPTPVPGLSEWAAVVLGVFLLGMGAVALRAAVIRCSLVSRANR